MKMYKPEFSKEGRARRAEKWFEKVSKGFPDFIKRLYTPDPKASWKQGGGHGFGKQMRVQSFPDGYDFTFTKKTESK